MNSFDAATLMKIAKAILEAITSLLIYFGAIEEGEDTPYQKSLDQILGAIEKVGGALKDE